MKNDLISIIIPVYKVEKYLEKCGSGSSGDEDPYGGNRKKYQPEPCNEAKCQIKLEDHPKRDFGFCEKSRLTIKKESVIILIVGIPNTEYQIP